MHEMSIAQSIVELIQEHAERDAFTRVLTVRLSLGALSQVDPRALEFGFDVVTRGTVAENAKLAIDRPPGKGYCADCEKTVEIAAHGDPCPACGGSQWMLVGGDEMRVVDLEVE
jgi:hydrogenase nickel incorporation protein HypA/HybF